MKSLGTCLACLLALLLAAPVSAAKQIAPPGNSGIDEYLETLPGAEGNKPIDRNRPNGGGGLTPQARKKLEALGPDGRTAAAVAETTAPGRAGRSKDSRERERDGKGDSALGAILHGLFGGGSASDGGAGSGGLGVVLPLLLFLSLGGAIALIVLRRRRAQS